MPDDIEAMLNYQKAIGYTLQMILAFMVLFQLPLLLLLLMWLGLVERRTFIHYGRYFAVLIFLVSALFTPPDPVSQVGLALPLILLYYLAIFVAKILRLGNSLEDDPTEPA